MRDCLLSVPLFNTPLVYKIYTVKSEGLEGSFISNGHGFGLSNLSYKDGMKKFPTSSQPGPMEG